MNCLNCGAPLTADDEPGRLSCSHCSSLRLLTDSDLTVDQVALLSQPADGECPACGIGLVVARLDDWSLKACPACRGLLFSSAAFGQLMLARRQAYAGPEGEPRPLPAHELERALNCPGCGQPMETHPYCGPGNTVVDSCYPCRLLWLDASELRRIETAPGKR